MLYRLEGTDMRSILDNNYQPNFNARLYLKDLNNNKNQQEYYRGVAKKFSKATKDIKTPFSLEVMDDYYKLSSKQLDMEAYYPTNLKDTESTMAHTLANVARFFISITKLHIYCNKNNIDYLESNRPKKKYKALMKFTTSDLQKMLELVQKDLKSIEN